MDYGSPVYMASLVVLMCLPLGGWLLLHRCSQKLCRSVILVIMLVNLGQHLCKSLLYPQYRGDGFTAISTASNLCGTLIILSPLVLLSKSRLLKNFVYFTGTVAGAAAIIFPYWYIGWDVSRLGWEYGRFYLCHALLFLGSVLPLLLGLHRPSYREFWQVGAGFFLALCIIFINDVICIAIGIYPGATMDTFYASMQKINPCGLMGPPRELPWLKNLAQALSPPIFIGQNPSGQYVPILWYAVPLLTIISLIAAILFALLDRKNLSTAWKRWRGG